GAIETALKNARAPLISVLNDDDLWSEPFLESLVGALTQEPTAACAFSNHHMMTETGEIDVTATEEVTAKYLRKDLRPGLHQPFPEGFVHKIVPLSVACVFRRDLVVDGYLPDAGYAWDEWITLLLLRSGAGAVFVPEHLASYRVHGGQMSQDATISNAIASL